MTKLERVIKELSDLRDFYVKTAPIRKSLAAKINKNKVDVKSKKFDKVKPPR